MLGSLAKDLSNEKQLATEAITPFAEEQMQRDTQPGAKRQGPVEGLGH
jgi:hypothetical protein